MNPLYYAAGRILPLPPLAKFEERGCVVLDQPQQLGKTEAQDVFHVSCVVTLLRLVPLCGTQPRSGTVASCAASSCG